MVLDYIKVILTYAVALALLFGGGYLLIAQVPLDDLTKGAIIGFIGIAINWTFGESTRSSAARQTTRALMTNTGPTITTEATTDPTSVKTTTKPATEAPEHPEDSDNE